MVFIIGFLLCLLFQLRCCSVLPEGVEWMRTQHTAVPLLGEPIQPMGVNFALGIRNLSDWSSNFELSEFLEMVFGSEGCKKIKKEAVLFESESVPISISLLHPLLRDFSPPLDLDLVVGSWHFSEHANSNFYSPSDSQASLCRSFIRRKNGSTCEIPAISGQQPAETESSLVMLNFSRKLVGNGSHRQLQSTFTIRIHRHSFVLDQCEMVVLEHLSTGIFADAYELQRLVRRSVLKQAYIYGDTDLERPAFYSRQSIVELHLPTTTVELLDGGDEDSGIVHLQATSLLPLHVRYAPMSEEMYYRVNITMPNLLLKCAGDDEMRTVVWGSISTEAAKAIHWDVPAGNPSHAAFVTIFTTIAAVTGVIVLTLTSCLSISKQKLS